MDPWNDDGWAPSSGRRGGDHPVVFGPVAFQPPSGPPKSRFAVLLNGVYLLVLGIWAVLGSWDRYTVLGLLAGLVYFELSLAATRTVRFLGRVVYSDALAQRIVPPLTELCGRAGCQIPRVVLRDDVVRAAAVRQQKGRLQLVLSKQFVERVDNRQLRAILAHEVAHIVKRDLRWAKTRAWVSILVGMAAGIAASALSAGSGVVFPVYLAGFLVASMAVQVMLAFTNRRLERRADLEGARIAEDPAGLASALQVAHSFTEEARTRIYGVRPWRWLLSPVSWSLPTHPPMAQRVATLDSITPAQSV